MIDFKRADKFHMVVPEMLLLIQILKHFCFFFFRKYIIKNQWSICYQICCITYLQSIVKIANIPRLGSIDICDN